MQIRRTCRRRCKAHAAHGSTLQACPDVHLAAQVHQLEAHPDAHQLFAEEGLLQR